MEKLDKRSEEETYLWVPFQFLDQTLRAIFRCLGLVHHHSPTTTSPVTLNQSEEEEDEDVATKEDVGVTTRGGKDGVVVSSRGIKVRAKKKGKERVSSGRPGQHH
ncbi:hypothetical protein EUTSA_v10005173mg [Eutrema salsugineum]|uniref:Elicitor peptide 1 n=2 Tax=Eutrema salsugineum TaxID=72664 RepID=V4MJ30_EUTSA|nr:hypothetical protein EUTSA_v10005173mg [Eutrema salsugineum]